MEEEEEEEEERMRRLFAVPCLQSPITANSTGRRKHCNRLLQKVRATRTYSLTVRCNRAALVVCIRLHARSVHICSGELLPLKAVARRTAAVARASLLQPDTNLSCRKIRSQICAAV